MQQEFLTLCPNCTVTVQDTQVGNLGVKLAQLAQTLLRRSPDITLVLPTYDAQGIYVVPAIKAANLDNPVEVIGSDAVTSNLDWIRHGNIQLLTSASQSLAGLGSARRGRGRHAWPEDRRREIPLRLFIADNLKGVSDDENEFFGGDFVAQYRKLWGLN